MNAMRYWYQLLPVLRRRPNDGLICALFDAEIEAHDSADHAPHRRRDRRPLLAPRSGWERDDDPAPGQRGRPLRRIPGEGARSTWLSSSCITAWPSRRCCGTALRRSMPFAPSPVTSSGTASACRRATGSPRHRVGEPRRAAVPRCRTDSTSGGPSRTPSPSDRASTSVSAPRSLGSSPAWHSRSSRGASPATPWTRREPNGCT